MACADACLAEPTAADLLRCITLNLDCADICDGTGRVLTRQAAADQTLIVAVLQACAGVREHPREKSR